MLFYTSSKEALNELEHGRIQGQDRAIAVRYIALCPECSYKFVKCELFQDREELTISIKRILKHSNYSASLLINCDNFLTDNERIHALSSALDNWEAAYQLLKGYDMGKDYRKQAIDMILMSSEHVKKFLQYCKSTADEKRLILNAHANDFTVLHSFLRYVKKGHARKAAFEILLNDADEVYVAAHEGRLRASELEQVYNLHSAYYFNKFKRNLQSYYTYCRTFKGLLTRHEEHLMIGKLRKLKYKHVLPIALEEVDFIPAHKEVLHSIVVANKLIGKSKVL